LPSSRRSLRRPARCGTAALAALALLAGATHTLAGCSERPTAGLACPVLAPGATAALTVGPTLHPLSTIVKATGALAPGGLAAHPLPLPPGAQVTVSATVRGAEAVLIAYGPRDPQGGYPACSALEVSSSAGTAATLSLTADDAGGEYLLVVATRPGPSGPRTTPYELQVACSQGCDAGPSASCPSLAELGCPHARCDGALLRDERGCLTCECRADRACDPEHQPGPWGACVSPACRCDGVPDDLVCGADGNTWATACEALCAGVTPVRDGPCAASCPEGPAHTDAECAEPCAGPRALDEAGCPTCACAPRLPTAASDCPACGDEDAPVCGSDGVTYRNRCHARCAGARVLYPASCVEPCRRPPPACDLDCPWGLLLSGSPASPGACAVCACAPAPPADCPSSGATVCAQLPALGGSATTGTPCMALWLGASDATWGPCALPCQDDGDCPAPADAERPSPPDFQDACALDGPLTGRCLLPSPQDCGCSSLHAPVCGEDGQTYANACLAHCAGVGVAQEGPCCDTSAPACPEGEVPSLDARGCPTDDGACEVPTAACLSPSEFAAPTACAPDGAPLAPPMSACEAHAAGLVASPRWCRP